jgi:4-amino-4-deoxy-L-arabinose transferase-like glycosyltransferase
VLALTALCLTLFFVGLGARPLYNQDEGMHAATSKSMVVSGDWITPEVNGKPFYDKPAFHNWLISLSFLVFGFNEFGARLPNAVMGLATVLATYFLGRRLYGPITGFMAGVVLATALEFFALSRIVMHDMSLAFFVTLGLALFYRGYDSAKDSQRWFLLCYILFGLAILTKGPLGGLVPGGIILLFLALRQRLGLLRRMSLAKGGGLCLMVAAPWFIAMSLANPAYAHYFFVDLNIGSVVSHQSHHPEPFYYYAWTLLAGFFPWSLFLPAALVRAWRRRSEDPSGEGTFLLAWTGVWFLTFSIAESKLSTYILPLYPAVALLVARFWHEVVSNPGPQLRRVFLSSFLPAALVPITMVHLLIRGTPPESVTQYGIHIGKAAVPVFGIALILALSAGFLLRTQARAAFVSVALSSVVFFGLFFIYVVPELNPYESSRDIARRMDRLLPPNERLACFGKLRDTALFYTERRERIIGDPHELDGLIASPKPFFCIIDREQLRRMNLDATIVMERGNDALISNQRRSTETPELR